MIFRKRQSVTPSGVVDKFSGAMGNGAAISDSAVSRIRDLGVEPFQFSRPNGWCLGVSSFRVLKEEKKPRFIFDAKQFAC